MRSVRAALIAATALFASVSAVDPVEVKEQEFVVSKTGQRFVIVGVDYQPGGEAGYDAESGEDPLSKSDNCLRDAALMQQLGINVVRVYNLNPSANHDTCASIFNAAGIYMLLDVNSPQASINRASPKSTYTSEYLTRIFGIVEAFRMYPNTLGFFGANELINDIDTGEANPPYIRAVQRDLKQYIRARGGRQIPVGYSAAQVEELLEDTNNYIQCAIDGEPNNESRADFFGLNDYQWCGDNTFTGSGYDKVVEMFSETTIPVFFSEYGCNEVLPRTFQEVTTLYSPQMSVISGGLVYQWTQDDNNFGIIEANDDGSASLLGDYDALQGQYNKLDIKYLQTQNTTATSLRPQRCSRDLIQSSNFGKSFDLPNQPRGAAALIRDGIPNANVGKIVQVSDLNVKAAVKGSNGQPIQGLKVTPVQGANTPGGGQTTGKKNAAVRAAGETGMGMGVALAAVVAVAAAVGLY